MSAMKEKDTASYTPASLRGGLCLLCVGVLLAPTFLGGCESTSSERPPLLEPARESATATSSGGAPAQPAPGTAAQDPAQPIGDRPSVNENMGRGFQGTLKLAVTTKQGERTLSYLARGNSARLQVDNGRGAGTPRDRLDRSQPRGNFDALIWDDKLSVLDHERRAYRTTLLDAVQAVEEPAPKVELKRTGERISLEGVICERYELTQGPLQISACVSPLPGPFDVDKLEALSNIDVPPWAERLLDEKMLPLSASVKDAEQHELYALRLVEYSAVPVDPTLLAIPSDYSPLEPTPTEPR
jgi:hypothetical protein